MTIRIASIAGRFLTILSLLALGAAPGAAEERDAGALQSAAAIQGDLASERQLGEAMVFGVGGTEQDVAGGLELLEKAAASGDALAQASLGKILLDGYYLPAEPERARSLLEEAATAGVVEAQTTLGLALLWGGALPADPARARALLAEAAGQGDSEAQRVLGEQLLGGWVLDRDTATGLAMLEQAVARNDPAAQVSLGSALLYGTGVPTDRRRALALFQAAADSGNAEGIEHYGEWLMWSERGPARAEAMLRRAGEMGRGSAWTILAEGAMYGYLPPRSRGKYKAFAAKARAAGQERVAVLDAQRQMWGIGMRASGPKTLALLEDAADAGNATAAKYLIALVRDGNDLNIRKRPGQARDYLSRYEDLLTPPEVAQLGFTIDAAQATRPSDYAALERRFRDRPDLHSVWFGEQIYAANANVAVYVIQADMRRRGLYDGRINGRATRRTLTALWRDCKTLADIDNCGDHVLQPEVIGALLAR